MAMVSTLLSNPLFKDFRIAAGMGGLHNDVSSTGYFEWEQDSDIVKNFRKGEFVITTLYAAKDDVAFAKKSLKLLINNHVAAIAIKDIYYHELPDEIRDYANQHQVLILFFSDVYIDDIIVAIRNELSGSMHTEFCNSILSSLLFDKTLGALEKEALLRRINPFFYSETIWAAFISQKADTTAISNSSMISYQKMEETLKDLAPLQIHEAAAAHAFAVYKRGIFLISTCNTAKAALTEIFEQRLRDDFFSHQVFDGCQIGIGGPIHGFADIADLLRKTIFANTSCTLDEKRLVSFSDMGTDALLLPHCYSADYMDYYDHVLESLSQTENSSSALIDTLLAFVHYGGNIEMTANALFQHKNTIRYRMNKISTLLKAENDIALNSTMYIFSRLYRARNYLDVFFET